MKKAKSFLIYQSTEKQVEMLTDEDAGKLFKAIFAYNHTGETPELSDKAAIVFMGIQVYMDENAEKWERVREKRAEAGRAGRRAAIKVIADESTSKQMLANASKCQQVPAVSVSVSESVSESVSVGDVVPQEPPPPPQPATPPPPSPKTPHGEFGNVMLTEEELQKFQAARPLDWEAKIARLDEYLEEKPLLKASTRYQDHLKVLKRWAQEDDARDRSNQEGSVHFANEARNKGNYDQFFDDIDSIGGQPLDAQTAEAAPG